MKLPLLLVPCCALVTACRADSDESDADQAEVSVDSAMTSQAEAALLVTLADGATAETTTEAAAAIAAEAVFTPTGCAAISTVGTVTTVVLDGCTGTRGLVELSGTIRVEVLAVTSTSVAFTAEAVDLVVNAAHLDLDVEATYRTDGATASIEVTSASTGSGPRGHELGHAGAYVATWDASCATVDGTWSTSVDDAARSLDVALTRCLTGCPVGDVSRTRLDGSSISIGFDGTATATWSSTRTTGGTIPLACTP